MLNLKEINRKDVEDPKKFPKSKRFWMVVISEKGSQKI